jgi:hypothetical protein
VLLVVGRQDAGDFDALCANPAESPISPVLVELGMS